MWPTLANDRCLQGTSGGCLLSSKKGRQAEPPVLWAVVGLNAVFGVAATILGHERGEPSSEAPDRAQRWKEGPQMPHSALAFCDTFFVIHSFFH